MITLPNGDKWIIDDSELKNAVNDIVPETKIEDFLKQLLYPEEEDCFIPRKYINENGGCWGANFNAHKEVLEALAVNIIHTDAFDAYEMPYGEIHVVYKCGGYDVEIGVISYPNKIEYNKAVRFKMTTELNKTIAKRTIDPSESVEFQCVNCKTELTITNSSSENKMAWYCPFCGEDSLNLK